MEIKIDNAADHLLIHLPTVVGPELEAAWTAQEQAWLSQPNSHIVLSFRTTLELKPAAVRFLLLFIGAATKAQKQIASLGLSDTITQKLKVDGVLKKFNPVAKLEDALPKKAPTITKADLTILNQFIAATQKTLEVQASTKCSPGKPYMSKAPNPNDPPTAIAGVLPINSDRIQGSITLCFPEQIFLNLYSAMVGETHKEITDETKDAAAELLNIIYGTAKSELNKEQGLELKPSLPTVITGANLNVHSKSDGPVLVIPFAVPDGSFKIEITLKAA